MLRRGLAEFQNFARKMYQGVIDCERELMGSSGLELFGRMDIGVLEIAEHGYQFYVNEIERSLQCGLFHDNFSHEINDVLWEWVPALPVFIRARTSTRSVVDTSVGTQ